MRIRHLALPTVVFCSLFTTWSARAADLDRALARIEIMTKVRVLLTAELRAQFTAAEFLLAAPDTPRLRSLHQRTLGTARGKATLLARLLGDLNRILDDDAERAALDEAARYLGPDALPGSFTSFDLVNPDGELVIADARGVMAALERAAPTLGDDVHSTAALAAQVDEIRVRADHSALPDLLGAALRLTTVQVLIAPVFARHSLARLCRDRLAQSTDERPAALDDGAAAR